MTIRLVIRDNRVTLGLSEPSINLATRDDIITGTPEELWEVIIENDINITEIQPLIEEHFVGLGLTASELAPYLDKEIKPDPFRI